nr:hypothetical protein [Tanacetum cinerariifolium]
MDINIDALYNILKQNQGNVNDAMGSKKKTIVVTFDPLALIAEKTNVSRSKEKSVVSSNSEGSKADDFKFVKTDNKKVEKKDDEKKRDMSRVKCYNCKKKGHFVKDCKKVKVKDYEYYKTKILLAKKDKDEHVLLAEDQAWMESSSDSDQEINANMKRIEKVNQQSKDLENENKDLQEKYDVLLNQVNTFEEQNNEFNEQIKVLNEKNADLLAKTEVLQDQLKTIHMIMPSKDTLYNGRKGIGFENPCYFEKAKDLRPRLYDEKVISLGYTPIFLIHSDEALEIEKFKRARENKIEFAYDYGNLNASYVNEKTNFSDDYFQEIINPNFEKIDSPFQQTSSLKP